MLYLENSTKILACPVLRDNNFFLFTNVMIKIMSRDCNMIFKKIYVCNIERFRERENEIQIIMKNSKYEFFNFKNEKEKDKFVKAMNECLKKQTN